MLLTEAQVRGSVLAHELGHSCDLPDINDGDSNRTMWWSTAGNGTLLIQDEAKKYDGGQ
jgi:hypothetical protein